MKKFKTVEIESEVGMEIAQSMLTVYDKAQANRDEMTEEFKDLRMRWQANEIQLQEASSDLMDQLKEEMGLEGDWNCDLTYLADHMVAFMTQPEASEEDLSDARTLN